jgi:hypothetical protein
MHNEIFATFSGGPPQRVNYDIDRFNRFTIWGYSGFSTGIPVNNTHAIYIGVNPDRLGVKIDPGGDASITLPDKHGTETLQNFWFTGTSGDGLWGLEY